MASANHKGGVKALYFEDLHVRQRFVSGTQQVDESQIKAFAKEFDPQPFHLDGKAAKTLYSRDWWRAAGTPPQFPCGSWSKVGCPSQAAS